MLIGDEEGLERVQCDYREDTPSSARNASTRTAAEKRKHDVPLIPTTNIPMKLARLLKLVKIMRKRRLLRVGKVIWK